MHPDEGLINSPGCDDLVSQLEHTITSVISWSKWHFSPDVRDDVAQTVRAELVKHCERLRRASSREALARRICVRRCIDTVRRQIRERGLLISLDWQDAAGHWRTLEPKTEEGFDPVATIMAAELAGALRRAVADLDQPCREVLREFYLDGLTYREISAKHSMAVNTVGSRLSRCLERLRGMVRSRPALAELVSDTKRTL